MAKTHGALLSSVAESTDRGRPAQYKQPSRKGKRAWRKNIDLSQTEAALEDAREQERVAGAPAHKRADAELFTEDRSGQETKLVRQARTKRPLKSQEILAMRSAAPAVPQRQRASFRLDTSTPSGKANASGLSEKAKKRLRILAARPHEGVAGLDEQRRAGQLQSDAVLASGRQDLWAEREEAAPSDWVSPAMQQAIRRPHSMHHEPHAPAKTGPAITAPHPGLSYNPDFDSHEALIQTAYEKAVQEEDAEQAQHALTQQWKSFTAPATSENMYMGMKVDEPMSEEDEDEEVDDDDLMPAKMPGRKTAAQRRREARAREQQRQAQQRRRERQLRAAVSELPGYVKQMKKLAASRAALVEARRQRKLAHLQSAGIAGYKLGRHVVPEERIDVQTGDELSDSLRRLRPEGNLFWDRFQNLQARGLAEPRRPVLPKKQRLKTKTYDRHSFKRD